MPSRLPKASDFSSTVTLSITNPPASQAAVNVIVLLHGLGDTHEPFTKLGQQLNLPETACISLRAPLPLPDVLDVGREGYHWGDDIVFDNTTGGIDVVDVPYNKSVQLLVDDVIHGVLVEKCGYALRDIMLFGFGQGGAVGLATARECAKRKASAELGGVVSIGGPLPSVFVVKKDEAKTRTPVVVCHGSSKSAVTAAAAGAIRDAFANVEIHEWRKMGDGMPASREEMLPIMRFFARRLRSRAGVPPGAMELT